MAQGRSGFASRPGALSERVETLAHAYGVEGDTGDVSHADVQGSDRRPAHRPAGVNALPSSKRTARATASL